jgi:dTDP-4-dehydrorhamnose 3,5-epimerase-like enzyme
MFMQIKASHFEKKKNLNKYVYVLYGSVQMLAPKLEMNDPALHEFPSTLQVDLADQNVLE